MDNARAKQFIERLCRGLGIRPSIDMGRLVDRLSRSSGSGKYSSCDTFEFSLVYPQESLRLLHLNFFKPLSKRLLDKITLERITAISGIIAGLNKTCGCKYNMEIMNGVIEPARNFLLPVQCGYTLGKHGDSVFKLYFSASERSDVNLSLLGKICSIMRLNGDGLGRRFFNKRFDAIGIDLAHDGLSGLKIYTCQPRPFNLKEAKRLYRRYYEEDSYVESFLRWSQAVPLQDLGYLWRVSHGCRIDSLKIWCRLKNYLDFMGIPPWPLRTNRPFKEWLNFSGRLISSMRCKISYLALENNRIGLYFR